MATPLRAIGFNDVLLFGKNAIDEHMVLHNRPIGIMQNAPVELPA